MKIIFKNYELTGTPAEMIELIEAAGSADPGPTPAPMVETPEQPKKPKQPKQPKSSKPVDWNKAKAFRDAGWSYDKIGDELGVSGVTVSAHLNK